MKHTRAHRFFVTAAALAACAGAHADSSGKWKSSQEAFDKVCAYCHQANVGPVITGRQLAPEYMRAIVRNGNRAMPAFRESEIDNATLEGVLKLINTSAPGALGAKQ